MCVYIYTHTSLAIIYPPERSVHRSEVDDDVTTLLYRCSAQRCASCPKVHLGKLPFCVRENQTPSRVCLQTNYPKIPWKIPWLIMVYHNLSFQMSFWVAKSFRASRCVHFGAGEADNALMDAAVLYLPSREAPCCQIMEVSIKG